MSAQAPLDLRFPRRRGMGRADFIEGPPNAAALRLVEGWRSWPGGRLALVGPEGAGKSHLAHVFAGETGAAIVSAAALAGADAPALLAAGACTSSVI